METCHYCGKQYHPMLVWVKGKPPVFFNDPAQSTIHACEDYLRKVFGWEPSDCEERARADGYVPDRKRTPRR